LCETTVPPNGITPNTTRITPEYLPLVDLTQSDIDIIVDCIPGGVSNIQDIYALSPLQDGMLFHHLMTKSGDPYLTFTLKAFDDKDSLDLYLAATQFVVDRHDMLRTSFIWENLSTPVQVVWRKALLSVVELQLDHDNGSVSQQLKSKIDHHHYGISLSQAPLVRFITAQENDGRWIVAHLIHHMICDNSGVEIMDMEIQAFLEMRGDSLPPSEPFRNLIARARHGSFQEKHEQFFKEILADIENPSLPYGLTDVHGDGFGITESYKTVSQELNGRLRTQAKRIGVSLATFCHLAWAMVVARATGQQNVVFGTVLFGRVQSSTNSTHAIGLFINTLPIRIDLDGRSVEDSVRSTHSRLAGIIEHEYASLAQAQRCSSVPAGTPLFSSLLNYRHITTASGKTSHVPGMQYLDSQGGTNYPIHISVDDTGDSLILGVQILQPIEADRVCSYMQQALESIANALEHTPRMPAARLDVLPTEERTLLLDTWNETQKYYPDNLCLQHLFEQQVERSPDAIAIVHGSQHMTYSELNVRANDLAHHLIGLGVKPDDLVAICVERSFGMIIGILAILKAGGAYVPLDPVYASDRLYDILSDASPSVVLADSHGSTILRTAAPSSWTVVDPNTRFEQSFTNPCVPGLRVHHLAYVLFTSGSTGKPKGVMVEHRNVTRLFSSTDEWFRFNDKDTWTLMHSFGFDVSVWEMWGALRNGGKLVLVPQDTVRSPQELHQLVCEQGITVLNLTPSTFKPIIDIQVQKKSDHLLRYVVLAGEALVPSMLQPWYDLHGEDVPRIVNMYGPTETIHATYYAMKQEDCNQPNSIIGVRLPDLRTYVLDNNGQPLPLGAVGELFIGGASVARGYLNRPDLTTERFIHDPFAGEPDARMYKTGDLVRYLLDGNMVYLGRNDDQVKIRGFRIELGEIEARLNDHPSVVESVVVAVGEESKRIVAYVVVKAEEGK
ncbi:hypothetical protein BGX31_007458, partial [Mortierella sp. GBA43]